ncbi:MAG TPA: LCP family protein [Actinomycetota bacterium]|nr:LCP family protein [Actinomycetota bacterium]
MKTSDEMWRWIWEDDDLLDDADVREVLGTEGSRPARLDPPPAVTTEGVWEWVASDEELIDEDLLDIGPPEPSAPTWGTEEVLSAGASSSTLDTAPPEPEPVTEPTGSIARPDEPSATTSGTEEVPSAGASGSTAVRDEPEFHAEAGVSRQSRAGLARWGRFAAFLAVAAVVGAVAPRVVPAVLPGTDNGGGPVGPPPDQHVVAWTVRLEEAPEATFVAILASEVKEPVIVAVPADITINVPGQGLGTVGEAAAGGDVGLVGVALENLVGVRMDGSVDSTTAELQAAVDALGTIEVADQPMAGAQVIEYLTTQDLGALPDERFLRWQDVLEGIRDGVAANPAAVAGFPEPLRPVLAAGSPDPMPLYALPVVDLGAGLLRPDEEGLEALVKDVFVPHAGDEVRMVVLNGVGRPGVGEEVARMLVPEGYQLVSTGNANTFEVKETKIISLSEEDLPAAQRARDLLGVGQVLMGFQPAGLADVQIVVGQDFVAAHLGGA